jgi:hypothetical protein
MGGYFMMVKCNFPKNLATSPVDVGKLLNYIKSVSQLSLCLSLFYSILFIIIVHGNNNPYVT